MVENKFTFYLHFLWKVYLEQELTLVFFLDVSIVCLDKLVSLIFRLGDPMALLFSSGIKKAIHHVIEQYHLHIWRRGGHELLFQQFGMKPLKCQLSDQLSTFSRVTNNITSVQSLCLMIGNIWPTYIYYLGDIWVNDKDSYLDAVYLQNVFITISLLSNL